VRAGLRVVGEMTGTEVRVDGATLRSAGYDHFA